jgi:hypothetical protein
MRLAIRLPERRLHEAIAGQARRLQPVAAREFDDLLLSGCGVQRIFAQPILVDGPFDPGQAERAGAGKFLAPFIPREGLDLAVDHGRQPSLHKADAFERRHGLPSLIARPFAVQPPSTNNSWPVT